MNPECSVVIPVYNREQYIVRTIRSVLDQTFPNFEIIAVDDGSTDQSLNILHGLAQGDPRILVIQNERNLGVAETRNRGIQLARGRVIALLDSDDIWLKDKLSLQMDLVKENGARLVFCEYGFLDREGKELGERFPVPAEVHFNQLLKRNVISCSTVLGDRQLFLDHPFNKKFYHEDLVAWVDMLKECNVAYGVQEELAKLTIASTGKSADKLLCARERWRIYREHLKMNWWHAGYYFVHYALNSIIKYRPIRKGLSQ